MGRMSDTDIHLVGTRIMVTVVTLGMEEGTAAVTECLIGVMEATVVEIAKKMKSRQRNSLLSRLFLFNTALHLYLFAPLFLVYQRIGFYRLVF